MTRKRPEKQRTLTRDGLLESIKASMFIADEIGFEHTKMLLAMALLDATESFETGRPTDGMGLKH